MKKKNITLDKKLFFGKTTLAELNKDAAAQIGGGAGNTGTGCECVVKTCGIIVCSAVTCNFTLSLPCC
ncbi:class I lanthipeptide [Taibaiella chishuiensis]|uniref:Uncharacterized protein n=1 Tax=Taibaiella chishuiensis TaxID=1434707 RepID=A0A2P8DBK1_9BACT|nr:class I lanthipeptide [Taibaiella chishuiensis]PSK94596.1 hypothetical protein B0I18_101752 [Taibaiella chishuiensis]